LLEAHERKPDEPVIYFLLGKSYESAGALQDRIAAAFEKYIGSDPRDAWAYYDFGMMLYQRGNTDAARQSFTKALALDPRFADAHLQLGILEQAEGRYEASVRSLEHAINANPNLGAAHYRLALAYQKLGDEEKSKSELAIFRRLKTGDQMAEDKARVREMLGR
jgi:tetratricopeptide (TPR) repeat protein